MQKLIAKIFNRDCKIKQTKKNVYAVEFIFI
jgi:hypothetical protein